MDKILKDKEDDNFIGEFTLHKERKGVLVHHIVNKEIFDKESVEAIIQYIGKFIKLKIKNLDLNIKDTEF
jgi:hypothetical protein